MRKLFNRSRVPKTVTPDEILAALSNVLEPEVNRDLVSLGMIHNLAARDGMVSFTVRLRDAGSPLQVPIERRARKAVLAVPGVREVEIRFESSPRSQLRETSRLELNVKTVIAVASSKGGVGKTTVAVNLAAALARSGQRVGLLDGDMHGPNVPLMMGIADEQPFSFGDQIYPPAAHGVTVMSMGLLVPAEAPVIWRGPMLHQAIRQLLRDVMWGELDILIVDLPPGTGDVQLTLTQTLPLAGAVMVTTPQAVALADVIKGAQMFRQLDVPILGLIENMSYYVCPHCGERESIFGDGGGERLSRRLGTPLLAQLPLDLSIRSGGDAGTPVVISSPDSPAGRAFLEVARLLMDRIHALPPAPIASREYVPDPELSFL